MEGPFFPHRFTLERGIWKVKNPTSLLRSYVGLAPHSSLVASEAGSAVAAMVAHARRRDHVMPRGRAVVADADARGRVAGRGAPDVPRLPVPVRLMAIVEAVLRADVPR